jgi:RNA polymerase-binding transcription factor
MNHTDFDLLKADLQTRLATIAAGSDKRGDIAIQQSADSLDQTQFATERDLVVSLLNRDSQMSRLVKGALRRMEDGTYGTCLACEDPVSVKRLQAVPWAELCLRCQEGRI